ncbi:MAG: multiheme c-type cytochrome [Desulfobacterales bacterium]|nr:multiheme c-type cytochrome [Desulfobacterales bacterium]
MAMTRKKKYRIVMAGLAAGLLIYIVNFGLAQTGVLNKQEAIVGRVMSVYGPVQDARVRVAGEPAFTLTDPQGNFLLANPDSREDPLRVTAGKEGWFSNGQVWDGSGRMADIFLNPVYLSDQPGYRFITPVYCSRCHVKVTRYWDKSKMAHTTSNPKVLDMYYGTDALSRQGVRPGYRLDNLEGDGDCISCHAPSVAASRPWLKDLKVALESSLTEWDGISCDYCHKIRSLIEDKARASGTAALMERQSSPTGSSVLVFGPYDDVVVPPMAASYNPVFKQSRFCSLCHSHIRKLEDGKSWDRSSVYSDAEWKGFGLPQDSALPIQSTYQEWKQWQDGLSAEDPNKGKRCQDCHMSWQKKMLPYDDYVVDGMARDMWGTRRSPQDIRPHHFEGATEDMLKTALTMEVDGQIAGKSFKVDVVINNTSGGHWVPTGEPMRSVMLLVQARDSKGNPLHLIQGGRLPEWTGKGKPEQGNYAGLAGAVFARVLADDHGNLNVPFWRATRIASDTRIRVKDSVTLNYTFALNDPGDEPSVEASLIYRPVNQSLADLKGWESKDILMASRTW